MWNLDTGDIENSFACTESEILCSVLSHDNEYIVVGAANSIVYIIRLETGEVVLVGDKHIDAVTALALTNDDSILISGYLKYGNILWGTIFGTKNIWDNIRYNFLWLLYQV